MAGTRFDADVAVVGLGGMGSQALWRLARRGVRVVGLDQFRPGHDRGASHGETRIIRTAYAEGAGYVPLLRESWRLWAELAAATGTTLLRRTGGLMLGPPDSDTVAGPIRSAAAHGLAYELLDRSAVRTRFPQHLVEPGIGGFYEQDAGVVFPERAVRAAVQAAEAAGAQVAIGAPVTEIVPDPERPQVLLADRTLAVRHVVVASGGWTAKLVPTVAGRLRVVRRVTGWFAADRPDDFGPDRFPVFIRAATDGWTGAAAADSVGAAAGDWPSAEADFRTWYGCPQVDGRTVKIGLHDWPGLDEPVDPAVGARAPDAADAAALAEVVSTRLIGLGPEPVRMASCTYTLTPDQHFLVGPRRDLPGLTLLAGFSGHGFKLAPVIGEIAAQLALTGGCPLPIEQFDPHRFDRPG